MNAQEIIKKGKVAVRNSGTLYPLYQNLFKEAFGFSPECPTCGSINGHKHWDAFVAYVNGADPKTLLTQNYNNMSTTSKTFEVKKKNIIYHYAFKKEGQDRDFISRTYGDVMTEEFALAYLDNAKDDAELLLKRKAEFITLPAKYAKKQAAASKKDTPAPELDALDLTKLKLAELQELAKEKGYPAEDWESFRSKADIIAYIDAKALETPDVTTGKTEEGAIEDLS